jgi:Beta-galactosidase
MKFRRLLLSTLLVIFVFVGFVFLLSVKPKPEKITYGMSFNTMYAHELGLDWKETYDAILGDLGVRHLRLAAHWPMVEPESDVFNFTELDYQVEQAEAVGAEVILAVGRRLPRWPECHVPTWARQLPADVRDEAQLSYMKKVIERYRDSPAVTIWQVENEPFLKAFAFEHCGELDTGFLDQEIALIRELDSTRPILVTDSGNLGTWHGAYQRGDIFGTSVYVHFWNPELGQFRTFIPPWFYRVKEKVMALVYGSRPTVLIELSAEPWLIDPIATVPREVQYTRMDINKFNDILKYAEATRLERQYLWGAEWWYWLLLEGDASFWERGKELYN